MENLGLIVKDEKAVVSSRDVARVFEKEHKNVLRDIRELDCSGGFSGLNFEPAEYLDEQGKPRPEILMTRDGFTFLAMGFTGEKAAAFKEAYISAFNEMERLISNAILAAGASPQLVTAVTNRAKLIRSVMKDQQIGAKTIARAVKETFAVYGAPIPRGFVSNKPEYEQMTFDDFAQ